jgi:hypothetical protein
MVAIVLGFADPQFSDQAAVGQRVEHRSCPVIVAGRESGPAYCNAISIWQWRRHDEIVN